MKLRKLLVSLAESTGVLSVVPLALLLCHPYQAISAAATTQQLTISFLSLILLSALLRGMSTLLGYFVK